jgi:hypothetical protein
MAEASVPTRYPAAAALEPTAAERRVLDAAARGERAAFDRSSPEDDRTLRAEFPTTLLLGLRDDWPVHPRGLRVAGAVVTGRFGLSYARNTATGGAAAPSFSCTGRTFRAPADLTAAHLDHVAFERCTLPALTVPCLCCARVILERSRIAGAIDLGGVSVDGPVNASFATGVSRFDLGESRIGGDVLFAAAEHEGDGVEPRPLRLVDANVTVGTFAKGRTFANVEATRARIGSDFDLNNAVMTLLDLIGARIGGALGMNGAELQERSGVALHADQAEIRGFVFLREEECGRPFSCFGGLYFGYAHLGGLVAEGARLSRGARQPFDDGSALSLEFARIDGRVNLCASPSRPFGCRGRIDLNGAQVACFGVFARLFRFKAPSRCVAVGPPGRGGRRAPSFDLRVQFRGAGVAAASTGGSGLVQVVHAQAVRARLEAQRAGRAVGWAHLGERGHAATSGSAPRWRLRKDSPVSSMRSALCTSRSRMASA